MGLLGGKVGLEKKIILPVWEKTLTCILTNYSAWSGINFHLDAKQGKLNFITFVFNVYGRSSIHFFAETGPATTHQHDIILHGV